MNKSVIIVAGGSGSRMQSEIPKQFLMLANKPIIAHTIQKFYDSDDDIEVIVVLPSTSFAIWKTIKREYFLEKTIKTIKGGSSRFHSVKNGLQQLAKTTNIVAVHDAVRPLVTIEIINKAFDCAKTHGTGIVGVPLKDTLRRIQGEGSKTLIRSHFCSIQTPQCFTTELISKAFLQDYQEAFTDDANVVENDGHSITISEGSYSNIKITTPEDLLIAETLLKAQLTS